MQLQLQDRSPSGRFIYKFIFENLIESSGKYDIDARPQLFFFPERKIISDSSKQRFCLFTVLMMMIDVALI